MRNLNVNNTKSEYSHDKVVDKYIQCVDKIGLWESEKIIFNRFINKSDSILDIGCGAGRTTFALYESGFNKIKGLDLSEKMIKSCEGISATKNVSIPFVCASATELPYADNVFDCCIFSFNGLMTIPLKSNRLIAMREINRVLKSGGKFIFTTHYMDNSRFIEYWNTERINWDKGSQDKKLLEYGDIIFSKPNEYGDVINFVHVPVDGEIEECLLESNFKLIYSEICINICEKSEEINNFSSDCIF